MNTQQKKRLAKVVFRASISITIWATLGQLAVVVDLPRGEYDGLAAYQQLLGGMLIVLLAAMTLGIVVFIILVVFGDIIYGACENLRDYVMTDEETEVSELDDLIAEALRELDLADFPEITF